VHPIIAGSQVEDERPPAAAGTNDVVTGSCADQVLVPDTVHDVIPAEPDDDVPLRRGDDVIGALVPTIVAFLRKHSSLAVGVSAAGVVKEAGRGECEACGRPAGRASPVSPEQEQPDAATTRNSALREKTLKRIGRLRSVPHASAAG
jgi:hypothetical protein